MDKPLPTYVKYVFSSYMQKFRCHILEVQPNSLFNLQAECSLIVPLLG